MNPEFTIRVVASSNCLFSKERANGRITPDSLAGLTRLIAGETILFGGYLWWGWYSAGKLRQSLQQMGFPRSSALEICPTPQDRLRSLLGRGLQTMRDFHLMPGQLKSVLVDGEVDKLVFAVKGLITTEASMQEAIRDIILVGFGPQAERRLRRYRGIIEDFDLRTLVLPSWDPEEVDRVRQELLNPK